MIYLRRQQSGTGGGEIAEVLRSAWRRLWRKQLLFLYPFVLAVLNSIAFLAIYTAMGGPVRWEAFAHANFSRWLYIHEHLDDLTRSFSALAIAALLGVAMCAAAAMIRAPFFRAIVGLGYPMTPRSRTEILRLALLYLVTYTLTLIIPYSIPGEGIAFQVAGLATLVIALVLIFSDYVVVFEDLGPWQAIKRSAVLLRAGWIPVLLLFATALLLWQIIYTIYGNYYDQANGVFALFPLSRLLVQSLVTTILDVVLIFTYDHLRKI